MSLHIYSVTDPEFAPYGRVVDGYDYTELLATLEKVSPCPEDAVIYVPGNDELEALAVKKDLENNCYGGMPIHWLLQRYQYKAELSGISQRQRDQHTGRS